MNKTFSVRLPPALLNKLQKIAKAEDRSVANVIIRSLTQHLKGKK